MIPPEFLPLLKTATDYTGVIVRPVLDELVGILTDTVGFWRLKNRVNVIIRAKEFCEKKKIDPNKVLPNIFVPLIEEAGNTDDPDLTEMFAHLLASHLDPDAHHVHPSFAKVLGQMSSMDAKILKIVDDKEKERFARSKLGGEELKSGDWDDITLIWAVMIQDGSVEPSEVGLCLKNLQRLGLLNETAFIVATSEDRLLQGIEITDFGRRLLIACSGDDYWRLAIKDRWDADFETFSKKTPSPDIRTDAENTA